MTEKFDHIDYKTCPAHLNNFGKVIQFMKTGEQEVFENPTIPTDQVLKLRCLLILEEVAELFEAAYGSIEIAQAFEKIKENVPIAEKLATRTFDFNEVVDALTDINYVTYGAFASIGVDADLAFDEVHYSNLSKFGENGEVYKSDLGKVIKGPGYTPPDWSAVFDHPATTSLRADINLD
jgi:predicted HAD superfamily Cof-like phosphohydrolase